MKTILLLGGSTQQIPAIVCAKKQGYRTILCDYLDDNPGQYHADKFYCTSTTDAKAVLQVALKENIDGIVAYASDPAAPVAAFIAEKIGLPTNPLHSVEILAYKDLFRQFLGNNGFNSPVSASFKSYHECRKSIGSFNLPLLIKPVDSSGSKGVTRVDVFDDIEGAFNVALLQSRKRRVIVEEFLEMDHRYLVGGDCFVQNGNVVFWGLLNCHRDPTVNDLVPVGKSHPILISKERFEKIKIEIQRVVNLLHIEFGAFNIEVMFDKNGKVYLIEMGPRNGGNMIPELLNMIYDVDLVKATIESAMGNSNTQLVCEKREVFCATHNLHSSVDGILNEINFDQRIEENIVKKILFKKSGDEIFRFDGANRALGIVFFEFKSAGDMFDKLENINELIKVSVV